MSKYRLFSLARASIFFASLCLLAAPAGADTLEQAIEASLNNHPSVEAAKANRDAYKEEKKEQWADYFPTLNVSGTGGRVFGDNSTSRGLQVTKDSAYSYLWEGALTLTQPIFDGFETENRVHAAGFREDSADYKIADAREDLALKTVLAYLDVLRSQEALARIAGHEKKLEDYQKRIQSMVDQGAADESMIVQARDIKAQLDNTLAGVQGQLRTANAKFAELTGYVEDDVLAKPVPRLDLIPDNPDDAVAFAMAHHPALKAAKMDENALASDTKAEKQAYYPDLNGELSYLERDQREEIGGELTDARAVLRLNWDISVAGAQVDRVRKSRYREFESRARREQLERQIERDVRIAYADEETAKDQYDILGDRMKINDDLFRNYEAQFKGARINLLQLLQADNARFNTGLSLMNAEYRLLAAQYAILGGMGRLQEALNVVPADTNEQ